MAAAAVQIAPVLNSTTPQLATQTEPRVPKHDVTTTLNYFKPNADGSDPAPAYINNPASYHREPDTREVVIKDIAGEEANYSLDRNGFQVHYQPATEKDFIDDEIITSTYYAETEKLLKDVTGADRIFIFDHTIRRRGIGTPDEPALRGPVQSVHIDQSYKASLSRVPHHLPDEADELVKGRVQIINVWRPIKTIERDPLAVAEADSVEESDLVTRGLIYPTRNGETYSVKHNKNHRWHYRSGLTPEQVLLIKCFDSKTDGRARRVPHTAFVDPSSPSDAPTRESIEVRALVFHTTDRD